MIKKRISLIMTIVMMTALLVPSVAFGTEKDYSGHWAEDTIQDWFDLGLIKGYEDGSFKPENSISRAEFMTMINNSFEFEEKAEINFNDVDAEEWYYAEVQKAVQAGYIVGNGDETIRPTDDISREEVAVIITRLTELDENSGNLGIFVDADEISDWAEGFVGAVVKAEYMIGNDEGKFCPTNNITRAESLVTLDRAILDLIDDDISENYAILNDLLIEGATLEQAFNAEATTYSAISTSEEKVTITAITTTSSAITVTSNVSDSEITVTASSDIDGNVTNVADVPLSSTKDTIVTIKVSAPGLEDMIYTITISKQN